MNSTTPKPASQKLEVTFQTFLDGDPGIDINATLDVKYANPGWKVKGVKGSHEPVDWYGEGETMHDAALDYLAVRTGCKVRDPKPTKVSFPKRSTISEG